MSFACNRDGKGNELILADSGSESDDNIGSSSDDSKEEIPAAFQEVRK